MDRLNGRSLVLPQTWGQSEACPSGTRRGPPRPGSTRTHGSVEGTVARGSLQAARIAMLLLDAGGTAVSCGCASMPPPLLLPPYPVVSGRSWWLRGTHGPDPGDLWHLGNAGGPWNPRNTRPRVTPQVVGHETTSSNAELHACHYTRSPDIVPATDVLPRNCLKPVGYSPREINTAGAGQNLLECDTRPWLPKVSLTCKFTH